MKYVYTSAVNIRMVLKLIMADTNHSITFIRSSLFVLRFFAKWYILYYKLYYYELIIWHYKMVNQCIVSIKLLLNRFYVNTRIFCLCTFMHGTDTDNQVRIACTEIWNIILFVLLQIILC